MAQLGSGADAGYLDPAVCAGCHRQIAEEYARTAMGRSFRSAGAGAGLSEFDGSTLDHLESRERFTAERRDGKYYVRRFQTGPDGKDRNSREVRVDYIIGSGNRARSYLHRTSSNRLVEFPVTWYPENGGHWGMSPAYDRPGHPGFSREIPYRCMFCHNGYPEIEQRAAEWEGASEFPSRLPEGIDCQRCHGPGRSHVEAARKGSGSEAVRSAIVNPARLGPERQLEVCMQCHLETTSMELPGAVMRHGRGVFSYRPGEPLADYILYFDHAPGTGHDDKFELVSSVYRLRKSACFRGNNGRLTCTSCHDPHRASTRESTRQQTERICQGCHAARVAKLVGDGRHTASPDCASCHMPRRQAEDAIHIAITDHFIQTGIQARSAPASSPPAVEQHDGNTLPYAGEVKLYYPAELPSAAENALYLAIAQVKQRSNLPDGLGRLERAIAEYRPDSARAYFEMAQAFFETGQAARALPFYQEAARREPHDWRYRYGLACAWLATGQPGLAVTALDRVLSLDPQVAAAFYGLGAVYSQQGNAARAVAAFRRAVTSDPESAMAANNLGKALLRAGNGGAAEDSLREALRLEPESAAVRANLADALIANGKLHEARYELEEAIRTGASTEVARSAWSRALATTGSPQKAQERYYASLRAQMGGMHLDLGTVLVSLGDREAALREYRLAMALDPGSAAARLNLALALAAEGDLAEARQRLEEALGVQPDLFAAHLKLGEIMLSQGEGGLAAAHLKRASESPDAAVRQTARELLGRR